MTSETFDGDPRVPHLLVTVLASIEYRLWIGKESDSHSAKVWISCYKRDKADSGSVIDSKSMNMRLILTNNGMRIRNQPSTKVFI